MTASSAAGHGSSSNYKASKKRASKTTLFGCLTSTQEELQPQQYNIHPPRNSPLRHQQAEKKSTAASTRPTRPGSPTKSVASCFTDEVSSKYVKENLSVNSDTSKVCKLYHEHEQDEQEDTKYHAYHHHHHHHHHTHPRQDIQAGHSQHQHVVSPQHQQIQTPNHSGSNSMIYHKPGATPISYASSSFNTADINEYTVEFTDIYDGVVEVENDKIIEEGDMSDYCSDEADAESTKAEEQEADICRDTPSIVYCEYDDQDIDIAAVHHHAYHHQQPSIGFMFDAPMNQDRESVIIKSPHHDVLGLDYNINTTKTSTLGTDISDRDDCDYDQLAEPQEERQHRGGIICEQQFIQRLTHELKQNGFSDNNLDKLWDQQLEINHNPQIMSIVKEMEMRDQKHHELADNLRGEIAPYLSNTGNSNSSKTPITPLLTIPIDRVEESEDDDLKHNHDHSMNSILAKMLEGVEDADQVNHAQVAANTDSTTLSLLARHHHEGPLNVEEEVEDEALPTPTPHHHRNNSSKSKSSKTATPSLCNTTNTSSNITTPSSTKATVNVLSQRRSGSAVSEEPEYFDGYVFFEKYEIGDKINEGGFGSVYKLRDNNLYSSCVKVMYLGNDEKSQTRRRKNCIREFNMTKKALSDEVIEVELYMDNIWTMAEPKAYLVQPYFEGKDLFEFIDDDNYFKKVNTQMILTIFYKIAEKLYDLHYFKRMVHGDLKPENVIILQSNKSDEIEVEIVDYGIAKSIRNLSDDRKFLRSKGHFGTKGYVAPELMKSCKYNRKIDVFSAGVVLYNMATECCLFPKQHKYYKLEEADYYKYLRKKFKVIKKKEQQKIVDILYSCLAYDPDERLDVKQLIHKYFHSRR
eukprot:CAMPEP_0197034492 /NCGR_PEP_ID=MMETSP1384-20130603/12597_1 /TAXON_ID=29189 /ORGANISM="Ammonia sp." /LENGTH=860 /DNA_ID=CAMNT_0042464433 /DNA_START=338 /DNA_END=2920 /DNA_ORIENTATION=-